MGLDKIITIFILLILVLMLSVVFISMIFFQMVVIIILKYMNLLAIAGELGTMLFTSVAFAGVGKTFSLIGGGNDLKRHDLQMEKCTAARNKWLEDRQNRIDMINNRLKDISVANKKFDEYKRISGKTMIPMREEPKFSQFADKGEDNSFEWIYAIGRICVGGIDWYIWRKKKNDKNTC